jgi:hypothetical protein
MGWLAICFETKLPKVRPMSRPRFLYLGLLNRVLKMVLLNTCKAQLTSGRQNYFDIAGTQFKTPSPPQHRSFPCLNVPHVLSNMCNPPFQQQLAILSTLNFVFSVTQHLESCNAISISCIYLILYQQMSKC